MKQYLPDIQCNEYILQGLLLGALPLTLLTVHAENPLLSTRMILTAAIAAASLLTLGTALLFRQRNWSKVLLISGVLLTNFLMFFEFLSDPLLTLFILLTSTATVYYALSARIYPAATLTSALQLERFLGCSIMVLGLTTFSPLFTVKFTAFTIVCFISTLIMLINGYEYIKLKRYFAYPRLIKAIYLLVLLTMSILFYNRHIILSSFVLSLFCLIFALRRKHADLQYLELILRHPARCLVLTFLALYAAGTLLLRTPAAMQTDLTILQAAFTAVSGASVTGLTVINIAEDLTLCGRFFLLILIQLGGLGIMTLTTLALHALGRLSLNGELLIGELTNSQDQNIFQNLKLIVRFTFITETIGAGLLTWGFYHVHHDIADALELGIFTSVSGFCNAGFFPGPENLTPYSGEKFLLLVIAIEIIIGGIAPMVTYSLLRFQSLRRLPFVSKLILTATAILLIMSTFLLLLFEWDGIFKDLAWPDKLVNGFFQAATLRTAGFNSVDISGINVPTLLTMLLFMAIGGSPGGTAGGIKTTTLAVLALTFVAAIRGSDQVIAGRHCIASRTVIKAAAIIFSAVLVMLAIVLMLVTTQTLPLKELLFEAVSALATVGLTLDCTSYLDAVGQIIIMLAMFIGRIGPLTLFLLLSDRSNVKTPGYPQIKIPLA